MRSMVIGTEGWTPGASETESGSTVQWEVLYDELAERVFRMLHRMVGDPEEASDLTHDAFVRIHQSRRQFAHRGPLHAWAFRIAANLGRDALRRRSIRRKVLLSGADEARAVAADARHEVERLSLSRALERLDGSHRTVLMLHDVDGYTHGEIAEMLAIAVGTSKARLSRARDAVRSALRENLRPLHRPEVGSTDSERPRTHSSRRRA